MGVISTRRELGVFKQPWGIPLGEAVVRPSPSCGLTWLLTGLQGYLFLPKEYFRHLRMALLRCKKRVGFGQHHSAYQGQPLPAPVILSPLTSIPSGIPEPCLDTII